LGDTALQILFIVSAFLFQIILIIHFALRKWHFDLALRYGPLVYALSLPAVAVSVLLLSGGKPWVFWLGGFIYLIWAVFGYAVEYVKRLEWRNPPRWSIGVPYVSLYLATVMFYWWPLALIYKPLWYVYAILFFASTILNVISHKGPAAALAAHSGLPPRRADQG
jgi:hypothetical protein